MSISTKALQAATDTHVLEIGSGVLKKIPELFQQQFPQAKAWIIADTHTFRVAGEAVVAYLQEAGIEQEPPFIFTDPSLYASMEFEAQIESVMKTNTAIPVAVGSGTINDLTKLAAFRTHRPYMCVATAASMDGYTAFGASITYKGSKQTFNCPAPKAVIADIEIIRKAPKEMTASGYADLFAKVTAGADWILADELGVEPIDPTAWEIVQDGLALALANPEGAQNGEADAITPLVEGLMLGGFAMQLTKTSRPASGAEHQFSHLWDMEHHVHNGKAPSHGFKVGIATIAVTALYEQMLQAPLDQLDVGACCDQWPDAAAQESKVREMFSGTDFLDTAVRETKEKYVTKEALAQQLELLKTKWPVIKELLEKQLLPVQEVKRRLQLVGAPTKPMEIGITEKRLYQSYFRAQHIRRRFTVLDVAVRTGYLRQWISEIYNAKPGF